MYFSAIFVSLTNPKAVLANIMIYPLFLDFESGLTRQAVILTLTAMAISFLIYSTYCFAATALKNKLAGSAFANKVVGSMYLGSASLLALK